MTRKALARFLLPKKMYEEILIVKSQLYYIILLSLQSSTLLQRNTKNENLKQLDFRVFVTQEQMQKLKEFLVTNNIKYGPVPKN